MRRKSRVAGPDWREDNLAEVILSQPGWSLYPYLTSSALQILNFIKKFLRRGNIHFPYISCIPSLGALGSNQKGIALGEWPS